MRIQAARRSSCSSSSPSLILRLQYAIELLASFFFSDRVERHVKDFSPLSKEPIEFLRPSARRHELHVQALATAERILQVQKLAVRLLDRVEHRPAQGARLRRWRDRLKVLAAIALRAMVRLHIAFLMGVAAMFGPSMAAYCALMVGCVAHRFRGALRSVSLY
jgi:hypothetical protein